MKKYISIIVLSLVAFTSCEEDLKVYDVENGQTLAQFSQVSGVIPTPVDGATLEVTVGVTTKSDTDRTVSVGVDASSTAQPDQYSLNSLTIPAGSYDATLVITSIFEALPETGSVNLVLNLNDISGTSDVLFANSTLTVNLFRECSEEPTPGVWTINMQDSFGDGWQTDDGNGGTGLTVTLSTGEVFEVGLCNPYVASAYDCTPEFSSGTATITIPDGVESAEWFFPGDFYGEITFQVLAPNGNEVYSRAQAGGGAGVFIIDYCQQ